MLRLSLVIPYLGNLRLLENTLVSVLEHRPEDCEILVVLCAHYDDPYDLKDEVRFIQGPPSASLAESINLGARASLAPLVHVLACGAEVIEGWTEAACGRFSDPRVAAVAPLVLDLESRRKLLAAGMIYRPGGRVIAARRLALCEGHGVLAAHPAAAFYRKSALEAIGPLDPTLGDHLSSIDLALAIEHAGLKTVVETDCRVFLPSACEPRSCGFLPAWQSERLYWRWAPYGGWFRSLACHALAIAGECCRSFPRPIMFTQLAGRLAGVGQIGAHRAHYRRLRPAQGVSGGTLSTVTEPHFAAETRSRPAPRRLVG